MESEGKGLLTIQIPASAGVTIEVEQCLGPTTESNPVIAAQAGIQIKLED